MFLRYIKSVIVNFDCGYQSFFWKPKQQHSLVVTSEGSLLSVPEHAQLFTQPTIQYENIL